MVSEMQVQVSAQPPSNLPQSRPYSRWRKYKNIVRNAISNPYNLMVLAAIVLLTYFIAVPLMEMIRTTFSLAKADVRRLGGDAQVGQFTLYYWKQILTSSIAKKMLYQPLFNSFLIAVSTSAIGVSLGAIIAWLLVRTDLPFKRFFSLAVIMPYMLPSWCKSMAWITVFKNERIGGTQGFLNYLGIQTPELAGLWTGGYCGGTLHPLLRLCLFVGFGSLALGQLGTGGNGRNFGSQQAPHP